MTSREARDSSEKFRNIQQFRECDQKYRQILNLSQNPVRVGVVSSRASVVILTKIEYYCILVYNFTAYDF